MQRGIDLKQKEVINIKDGKILGFVIDINAEIHNGKIKNIIVAQTGKLLRSISGKNKIEVPWENVTVIGEDVILVDM